MKDGDTLYVCGAHVISSAISSVGAHGGTSNNPVTIRGDYGPEPGSMIFQAWTYFEANAPWTTISKLAITKLVAGAHAVAVRSDGLRVRDCTITGGVGGVYADNVPVTLLEVTGCDISGTTEAAVRYMLTSGGLTASGINISNNNVHDHEKFGIDVRMASTAGVTSYISNVKLNHNTVYNTVYTSISFGGSSVNPGKPSIYHPGVEVIGNDVHDCGHPPGPLGNHGGLGITGAVCPVIYNNRVRDCYVTGGGIQTQRNLNPVICFNTITGIRSGSPTSHFQNGLPIDGNGVFFDNDTVGGVAYGNYISDLVTTGNIGSGAGLAIWDCQGVTYFGNIVENVACGAFYGSATETGNAIYNNTVINSTVGIHKVGTTTPAGIILVKNNILKSCTTGFDSVTGNPMIDADYNCIHGSTTPYSVIPAGSHDLSVDPNLDSDYRPRAVACKRSGEIVSGKDYYGKRFYNRPNIGAVDDLTDTPRYFLKR